ncbi:hypothetical protein QYF36_010814 [Acer negundo]|nr:hypothetical protein QYF36_010814 [Acer negundo]
MTCIGTRHPPRSDCVAKVAFFTNQYHRLTRILVDGLRPWTGNRSSLRSDCGAKLDSLCRKARYLGLGLKPLKELIVVLNGIGVETLDARSYCGAKLVLVANCDHRLTGVSSAERHEDLYWDYTPSKK